MKTGKKNCGSRVSTLNGNNRRDESNSGRTQFGTRPTNTKIFTGKKFIGKSPDDEAVDNCEACENIRNGVCQPFVPLKNDIPHTCCDINDEASRKRIEMETEIAMLLKSIEEEILDRARGRVIRRGY